MYNVKTNIIKFYGATITIGLILHVYTTDWNAIDTFYDILQALGVFFFGVGAIHATEYYVRYHYEKHKNNIRIDVDMD